MTMGLPKTSQNKITWLQIIITNYVYLIIPCMVQQAQILLNKYG